MTLTGQIIGAALEVHHLLGAGFIESIYHRSLLRELKLRGLSTQTELLVEVRYKDECVGKHRLDIVVDNLVIVELKAASAINEVHKAQVYFLPHGD